MTCKDCIHFNACKGWINENLIEEYCREQGCEDFKDTRSVIELPMPADDWLRAELTKYCEKSCVEEL